MRRVAVTALVLALIGGTAAAFTITEALKLEPLPVTEPVFDKVFSPTCRCPTRVAKMSFRLRSADELDLTIASDAGTVRTLARDVDYEKGQVRVRWDGRDDAGEIVADGIYRLHVHLEDAGRTVVFPRKIRLDTEAPELEIVEAPSDAFSPDGDGRRDTLSIVYRASDEAAPLLFAEGRTAVAGRMRSAGEAELTWDGRVDGRPMRAGAYPLFLRVRDAAGNLSSAAKIEAEVRYIELVPSVIVVRRGSRLRFRVVADAANFSWTLRRPNGRVVRADARTKPGTVFARLPSTIRVGRYILEVAANGHRDRAVVHVVSRRG